MSDGQPAGRADVGPVYDRPDLAAAYAELPRSRLGLDGAPEWPRVRAMLPRLDGADVVDLGCGYGAFARWAAEQGAASVLGLDVSVRMLDRARADVEAAGLGDVVHLEQSDLEQVRLRFASYDLAYSALTLHYLDDALRFLRVVNAGLRVGGRLVLTCEHPIFTAPTGGDFVEVDGRRVWPLDHYAEEGPRYRDWLAPDVVKQHRTLGTLLSAVATAGLVLREVCEWAPTVEQVDAEPAWAGERDRPMFLLLRADKPSPQVR